MKCRSRPFWGGSGVLLQSSEHLAVTEAGISIQRGLPFSF